MRKMSETKPKEVTPPDENIGISESDIDKIIKSLTPSQLKKMLDVNGDGKFDWSDVWDFLKTLLAATITVYMFMFIFYGDQIIEMLITGNFDASFLYTNLVVGAGNVLYTYLKRKYMKIHSSETKTILAKDKIIVEKDKKIKGLEDEIVTINHNKELEIKELNTTHRIELNNKDMEIQKKVFQDIEKQFMINIKDMIVQNKL